MSKCHVKELTQVFEALFRDATNAYPTLGTEFERDLARLKAAVVHRGIRVFLEDLPALGKHLDRCLSEGEYKLSGLPLSKRYSGRVVIPKFLRGLYLLVFDSCGRLMDVPDIEAIFFLRQILYVAKKYLIDCADDRVVDTVRDFIATDEALPEQECYWDAQSESCLSCDHSKHYLGFACSEQLKARAQDCDSDPCGSGSSKAVLMMLDTVSGIITSTLGPYKPSEWKFRHGPGAISEVVGPSNKYHWYSWTNTLESVFPFADCAFHSWQEWAYQVDESQSGNSNPHWERLAGDSLVDARAERVPSSRLISVPKTFKGPRLIAAEPSSHQWCQQNIWHYFRERTQHSWIGNFIAYRDRTVNQELCRVGSRDASLATVDLSAASDRVTCHVVGQFFRGNSKLLRALRASRTRVVTQDIDSKSQSRVALRKFSTMGSACTFPVQSLIFLGIAVSCVLVKRGLCATRQNIEDLAGEVAVFGDDIIIPVDSRELLEDVLEVLYFKINDTKSHWTGKFRESCGLDCFAGVDVTPVYYRRSCNGKPESVASTVECRNNFYKKWLMHTASTLASTLPKGIPFVANDSGVFGLNSRCKFENIGFPTRYNSLLQREEIRVRTIISSQCRSPVDDISAVFQFFTEDPDPVDNWCSGVPQRPRLRMKQRWETLSNYQVVPNN